MRRKIKKIRKRDGRIVDFQQEKITNAIFKAMVAVGEKDKKLAKKLSNEVVEILEKRFEGKKIPSVEEIQDIVEEVLIKNRLSKVAKAYILYRKKRAEIRKLKRVLGVKDDLKLSLNAIQVLKARYLLKDERGRIIETPKEMFRRVAKVISLGDEEKEKEFFEVMSKLEFLPNSPTLMNAGTRIGQLSACFVLPVEDSIEGIFEAVKNMAIIHKSGGGCIRKGSRVFSNLCGSKNIEEIYEYFEKNNKVQYNFSNSTFFIDISQEDLKVPSFDKKSGRVLFKKVTHIWKYLIPSEKTLKIICENGYIAEVSEWHPFFVFDGREIKEKRADELKSGDYLIISNQTIIDSWPFTYQHINGIRLDERLAWLVGIFLTDGAISKTKNGLRVRFFSTNTEIINNLLKVIEDKTQKKYAVSKDKRSIKTLMIISVYDRTFTEAIKILNRNIVGRKDNNCRIPEQIFKSPISVIGAFLAGIMDGDGYVSNNKRQIEISTASKDFAEDLSSLLYLFGIKSRYRIRRDKRNKKWLEMHEIAISGETSLKRFAQLVIPFMVSTEKVKRLKKHISLKHSSSPAILNFKVIEPYLNEAGINTRNTEIWRKSIKVGNKKFFLARWKEKNKVNISKVVLLIEELLKLNLSKKSKEKLRLLLHVVPNLIKIKKVIRNNSGEILEFYDFTVEDTNNYLAGNGGLCFIHNTGFSFSRLRPKGDIIKSTMGVASGPVSFLKVFDITTEVIKQGGKRRGANMGILRVDHPDIVEFITAKEKEGMLRNFNISVGVTDSFMEAVENNEDYYLVNPRNKKKVKKINAGDIFDLIVSMAWRTGDPGLIFLDEINRHNPTPSLGEIESTNPCVTGDTLVATSKGLESIDEIVGKEREILVDPRLNGGAPEVKKAKRIFKSGIKKAYKLRTRSGYELKATRDHLILTPNGWYPLYKLKKGDKVLIQSIGVFNKDDSLPFDVEKLNLKSKRRKLNLPNKWSRELGQVLGWLIGDGALTREKAIFYFGIDEYNLLPYFTKILNKWNNCEVKPHEYGGVRRLQYHAQGMIEFFSRLGVKKVKSMDKEVPKTIFTATKEAVSGFLQALFTADGTIGTGKNRGQVRLTTASEILAKQVQLLLLSFGIKSKRYRRRYSKSKPFVYTAKKGEKRYYESRGDYYYELVITRQNLERFYNEIGFLEGKKEKVFIERMPNKRGSFYTDTFEDEVDFIEEVGLAEVYDLTESYSHSFIANGIIAHNCGEVPLLPYESCNLGSINLAKVVEGRRMNWKKLAKLVNIGVEFLDNVIDANKYPLKEIEKMTKGNRKIGLGVMGFAEALIKLRIPYASRRAVEFAEKLMRFISEQARKRSEELGEEKGSFPNFDKSVFADKYKAMRNATVTSIAPTGSISIIAGTTSGIEPIFAVVYLREILEGMRLVEINQLFENIAIEREFYSEELMEKVAKYGIVQGIEEIPEDVKELFKTALEISPEQHVRIQAAFQKYVDNAVAKTVNLPYHATIEDVRKVFWLAYKLKCKGVTVYRYGSKEEQVLYLRTEKTCRMETCPL